MSELPEQFIELDGTDCGNIRYVIHGQRGNCHSFGPRANQEGTIFYDGLSVYEGRADNWAGRFWISDENFIEAMEKLGWDIKRKPVVTEVPSGQESAEHDDQARGG